MLNRKRVLIIGVCLLVAAATYGVLLFEREPSHNGRTLWEWHEQWFKAYENGDRFKQAEAHSAIRQIGTNAIPYALKTISHPFSHEFYSFSTLPLLNRLRLSEERTFRKIAAAHLFFYLGAECKPWIPQLVKLMNETEFDEVRSRATFCLIAMGDVALREITNIVANTNHPSWRSAVYCLKNQELELNSTRAAVFPLLIEFCRSNDSGVSSRSLQALGAFRLQSQVVIPIFTNAWHHTNAQVRAAAVSALGHFNERSFVQLSLSDSEYLVRDAATNALQIIQTNAPRSDVWEAN